ncbi:MAG: AAA family ATPase [Ktedonobacteraceae bacterium]
MATLILNSLEIRNFRAFHNLGIERLGRVNLIVGKNNVGKTSLLEALQLYARRASTAAYIWDIMRNRREMRQSFKEVKDMLATLKYLFYGRKDVLPGLESIKIGPINVPGKMLFIGVDWSVFSILPDGRPGVHPLKPEEEYITDNLVPRLFIQADNSQVSFQLDPSAPPGGYKLNANEIPCVMTFANGLSGQRLTELWDGIALTDLENEVLSALQLIAPGVKDLNFVSTPLSGSERIPVVRIADMNEPLPLYSLGDGMLRTLDLDPDASQAQQFSAWVRRLFA